MTSQSALAMKLPFPALGLAFGAGDLRSGVASVSEDVFEPRSCAFFDPERASDTESVFSEGAAVLSALPTRVRIEGHA
jgi:hypothetical protein